MKTLTLLLVSAFALAAQTTANLPALTISTEATAALNAQLAKTFVDGSQPISLTAPVGIADTVINVVSTATVGAASAIALENEACRVTGKTVNTLTVTRGYYGTTPAAHPQTAQANELKYQTFNKAFIQAIADFVGSQMDQANSATVAAQNTVITSAQAAKAAAKTAAVQ